MSFSSNLKKKTGLGKAICLLRSMSTHQSALSELKIKHPKHLRINRRGLPAPSNMP